MCGIVGIIAKNEIGKQCFSKIPDAVKKLNQRGPDSSNYFTNNFCALGHARLSIIDVSNGASQPMYSKDNRYVLVFNGEIYNFKKLRDQLVEEFNIEFSTQSDTEVLLHWLIQFGKKGIADLSGFFAFCLYDSVNNTYLLGRDRFGIKPLLVYEDDDFIAFASELKALYPLGIKRNIDADSLKMYFKLSYIPQPFSIYQNIEKVAPGYSWKVENDLKINKTAYYKIAKSDFGTFKGDYESAQKQLRALMEESVQERMIADVPLGTFLSGGIDSSVITGVAAQQTKHLNTFSIGYKDEPLFDETSYAELVAKKFKTNHTAFKLTNDDLFDQLDKILDYTCEPMADSSGLAVNILCEKTRKKVTVALSGDGADEIFSGYNKHQALFMAQQMSFKNQLVKSGKPFFNLMPKSRNSKIGNLVRKLDKYSTGLRLNTKERYWLWAGYLNEFELNQLIQLPSKEYIKRKNELLDVIKNENNFNDILHADVQLVLAGDMLAKVDLNSMCNSLEVRVPFLDHKVVDFAFSLPVDYKIKNGMKKRILQDTYKDFLPQELYNRPKHGFEVPLLNWFKTALKDRIFSHYLEPNFIKEQQIFNPEYIESLKKQLFSKSPGDVTATIWGLIVFQHWYIKYHLS